jgi:hypothetical protein
MLTSIVLDLSSEIATLRKKNEALTKAMGGPVMSPLC